ncbi:hypothetical protein CHUAL_011534 [Chamberlinius hualienensis]
MEAEESTQKPVKLFVPLSNWLNQTTYKTPSNQHSVRVIRNIRPCYRKMINDGNCTGAEHFGQQQQRTRKEAVATDATVVNEQLLLQQQNIAVETSRPPSKSFLLYLVRMGSFTSTPQLTNEDKQDRDICEEFDAIDYDKMTIPELLERCQSELKDFPPLLPREFTQIASSSQQQSSNHVSFRLLQWNVLSQALGLQKDNFVMCPREALDWPKRRFRMLEEILTYSPDFICLQEVDHFKFLQATLAKVGYRGKFVPKPDSPCIYVKDNNGPDGCAIFFNYSKFELIRLETRIVEIWYIQSNQVALLGIFRLRGTQQEICVVTTHLKARRGTFLSNLRNEQGKDLLEFIHTHYGGRPVLICGDFNAEPSEMVYSTMLNSINPQLSSCYASATGVEPPFTTWKIRDDGEVCHTLDYIFYNRNNLQVDRLLRFPDALNIGRNRVPSLQYPSDHFSLVADFTVLPVTSSRY